MPRGSNTPTPNISTRPTICRGPRRRGGTRVRRPSRRFARCSTPCRRRQKSEKRDHALVAFSDPLWRAGPGDRLVPPEAHRHRTGLIQQNSREVRTKRAKTFTTWFFPVGDDFRQIVVDWVAYLRKEKGFGPDNPLFPKTKVAHGDDLAVPGGLARSRALGERQSGARYFREACARAGLPYFNPHSLRNTLVQVAYDRKLDAEAFKAWSQNLGHESCLTTFSSYGTIPPARQGEIIRRIGERPSSDVIASAETLRLIADQMMRGRAAG